MGEKGLPPVGSEYYKNLLTYINLDDKDQMCRFGQKICINEIKRILRKNKIEIVTDGKAKNFNSFMFSLFQKEYDFKNNSDYCKKYIFGTDVYLYSNRAINLIIAEISKDPTGIIDKLIEKHKTKK